MRLRYVTDDIPGWTRRKGLFGFVYKNEHGRRIWDRSALRRIRSLGIPPAYTSVWICPFPHGHIQATALDAKRRKQYFYHPDWITHRSEGKFHRMREFVASLSRIRRRVDTDLRLRGMPKAKVLAAIVRLLDTAFIRIGNEEYAKDNHSFGLTTLRNRHVKGTGEHMELAFDGKAGIAHIHHEFFNMN
jgi:DNA topoisomerase-1